MQTRKKFEKKLKEPIQIGELPDGRKAIIRPYSRQGCPILEIRAIDCKEEVIKIKYEDDINQK